MERIPFTMRKRLNEKDKEYLLNMYRTLQDTKKLFINTDTYEVFIKFYPEVRKYYKYNYENGYIIIKEDKKKESNK